jgi:cation:H+ antiporter
MFVDLPVLANAAVFAAAAAVVWMAGTRLAHSADAIATETGLGREILGVLLLGGITSLPELAVATTATLQGTPTLSVNDVLGSAAINVVILAIADAVSGPGALTAKQASPGVLLQGVLGIVLMTLAAGAALAGDHVIFGLGLWCWLMLVTYAASLRLLAASGTGKGWKAVTLHLGNDADEAEPDAERKGLRRLIAHAVAAGMAILVAGFLLAQTGEALAVQTGLGASFFGAVFLALSTSLPELSTVIAAVRLQRYEMAISDVFGTNLFNVTIIVLVDALHSGGSVLVAAGRFAAFGALLSIALTALFLIGILERRNSTVLHMGWDSLAVLIVYAAGVSVLYNIK